MRIARDADPTEVAQAVEYFRDHVPASEVTVTHHSLSAGPPVYRYFVVRIIDEEIDRRWNRIGPYNRRRDARKIAMATLEKLDRLNLLDSERHESYMVVSEQIGSL